MEGAVALVLDLAKAFERVSLLGLCDTLQFRKEDFTGALRLFRAPEEGAVRRMCGRAFTNHPDHLAGDQVELFVSADRIAGSIE